MANKRINILGRVVKQCYLLLSPRSRTIDVARREFILNILLFGSIVLSFLAVVLSTLSLIRRINNHQFEYVGIYFLVWTVFLLFLISFYFSKTGKSKLAAFILITLYYLAATSAALTWSVEIPSSILLYALLIILSGILVNSKYAFISASIITITILGIILIHDSGIVIANLTWRSDLPIFRDGIVYSSILFTIAIVSWLFNREMERALERARISEAALKSQKDQLEIMVAERTQQLKKVQVEKLVQLYRFAEFGKLSSGLFHEIVTPLNLISLNLQQVKKTSSHTDLQEKVNKSLARAMLGTERIESYLRAARKQIQTQDISEKFSVNDEIRHVLQILKYKASKEKVKITFESKSEISFYGNPLKFNQLITNLVSNGIDAYDKVTHEQRIVKILMKKLKNIVTITIQDWGSGIAPEALPKIYEPLFTTKSFEKGTGIGLALCKDIIEKDFKGIISVTTKVNVGTTFTLTFDLNKMKK